jgi:hypothetical protein
MLLTFEQDEWFKVGTDCPLCKADFKNAAPPQADYREDMDENIDDGPFHLPRHDVFQDGASPHQRRNVLDSDDHDEPPAYSDDDDEPPALPHPSSSVRPSYSSGHAIGYESADIDLASSRGDAIPAPPPRSRRGSRRAPAADIQDAPSDGNVNIHELGRVVAAQPSRVRLPALQARSVGGAALSQARSVGGAALSQHVASSDVIGASGASAAISSPVGVSRQSNRGPRVIQQMPRVIQQMPSAAYNTGPLDQIRPQGRESSVPRARNRMDQA